MDENFIADSFKTMGENVLGVRIMRNKFSGQPLGYCFVHFADEKTANLVKIKLHGKPIPNSHPVSLITLIFKFYVENSLYFRVASLLENPGKSYLFLANPGKFGFVTTYATMKSWKIGFLA